MFAVCVCVYDETIVMIGGSLAVVHKLNSVLYSSWFVARCSYTHVHSCIRPCYFFIVFSICHLFTQWSRLRARVSDVTVTSMYMQSWALLLWQTKMLSQWTNSSYTVYMYVDTVTHICCSTCLKHYMWTVAITTVLSYSQSLSSLTAWNKVCLSTCVSCGGNSRKHLLACVHTMLQVWCVRVLMRKIGTIFCSLWTCIWFVVLISATHKLHDSFVFNWFSSKC